MFDLAGVAYVNRAHLHSQKRRHRLDYGQLTHPGVCWIPVVFITKAESRTSDMRGVLPPTVPFADAVAQAARSALLATAVATGDVALLRLAMDDRLHQPYRLPRLPDSAQLIDVAYAHGAAAACLSGAGPSVLALCDSPAVAHGVEKAMNAAGVPGMATRLRFDEAGARISTP